MAKLLPHQGKSHELIVFVSVADNHVLVRFAEAEHSLQLRFRSALQTHPVRCSELHDLLDDVTLLIDFNGIHGRIPAVVPKFSDRACESLAERFDTRSEDIREPKQHGQRYALLLKILR